MSVIEFPTRYKGPPGAAEHLGISSWKHFLLIGVDGTGHLVFLSGGNISVEQANYFLDRMKHHIMMDPDFGSHEPHQPLPPENFPA